MQPDLAIAFPWRAPLRVDAPRTRGLQGGALHPRVRVRRRNWLPAEIEQIEGSIGYVQLLHRVSRDAGGPLRLEVAGGAHHRCRRIEQRGVESSRNLIADGEKQARTEQQQ